MLTPPFEEYSFHPERRYALLSDARSEQYPPRIERRIDGYASKHLPVVVHLGRCMHPQASTRDSNEPRCLATSERPIAWTKPSPQRLQSNLATASNARGCISTASRVCLNFSSRVLPSRLFSALQTTTCTQTLSRNKTHCVSPGCTQRRVLERSGWTPTAERLQTSRGGERLRYKPCPDRRTRIGPLYRVDHCCCGHYGRPSERPSTTAAHLK